MRLTSIIELFRSKSRASWLRSIGEIGIDLLLINFSLLLTYGLCYDFSMPHSASVLLLRYSVFLTSVSALLLIGRRLYSINARYIGLTDFLNVAFVGFVLGISLGLLEMAMPLLSTAVFRAIAPVLFALFSVASLSAVRIAQRLYSWHSARSGRERDGFKRRKTLIVGAGDAGELIMREISRSRAPNHFVVGFIDDDPNKLNLRIHGVKVLGSTEKLPFLIADLGIEEVLIAVPSAQGSDMRRIISLCDQTGARVRTLPAVSSLLLGGPQIVQQIREVDIEDLLRRPAIKTDLASIALKLNGERVMITGGGGSIGSELARQIANFTPASLVLLGRGENSIYEIEQELVHAKSFVPFSIVADVRDRASMERAFEAARPTIVFHAAAHKHVPLMQGNPIEAIRNNVYGTWLVAELAVKYGAKQFIYVSTDKAVKPTSVMGATKRVGEMIVSALGQRSETDFAIVRFGNVMGSRGSLIPLLKAQIRRGGPVRVTHPDMTRYFMTIPESVQLILQAGAIGEQGEIFLLDMGEPIPILNLANDLIRLHGLVPGKDIEIQFSGMRPGEKIHEELLYEQEELSPTPHPKISKVNNGSPFEWNWLKAEVERILELCDHGLATEAQHALMELAWGKLTPPFTTAAVETEV